MRSFTMRRRIIMFYDIQQAAEFVVCCSGCSDPLYAVELEGVFYLRRSPFVHSHDCGDFLGIDIFPVYGIQGDKEPQQMCLGNAEEQVL